jgi:flagellar basal body rod protein FlgG
MSSDIAAAVSANMDALTEQYRTITQNIANANTSGYKRSVTSFASTLAAAQGGASAPSGQTQTDFTQGHLMQTGRNLDLALEGKGFFEVDTPQGVTYTRGGVFNLNPQGQLVDFAGNPVAGESGPITVPRTAGANSLTVSATGDVSAGGQKLGKLKIVEFPSGTKLESLGNCCYRAPVGALTQPVTKTVVHQDCQEASNVSIVEEMVDLVKVTRMYEANAKTITTQDEGGKALLRVAMG